MAYYPIFLEMRDRPCLVVGGGPVAERKVEGLLDVGAAVTVVSPAVTARLDGWAGEGRIRLIRRRYGPEDLAGHALVFVATDDEEANAAVSRDAPVTGAWVNAADDPARCDFILPSVLRRGQLVVAVGTGGASPALSRMVREELEAYLEHDYAALVDVAADVRRRLRERALSAPWVRWRDAVDTEVRQLVSAGRLDEARGRLLDKLHG